MNTDYCVQCGNPYGGGTAHMCTTYSNEPPLSDLERLVKRVDELEVLLDDSRFELGRKVESLRSTNKELRQIGALDSENLDVMFERVEELEQTVREQAVEIERLHYHDFVPNDSPMSNEELLKALTELIEGDRTFPFIPAPLPQPYQPYIPTPWQTPIITWDTTDTNPGGDTVWEAGITTDAPLTQEEINNCELERPVRKTPCGICPNCIRKYRT